MERHRPWLCQGDLFDEVPLCTATFKPSTGLIFDTSKQGAALLIIHGCQVDKRTHSGRTLKVSRLQFVPVLSLASAELNADTVRRLREGDWQPPEAVYLDLGQGNEGVCLLGEAYPIPAAYFALEPENFKDHPDADPENPVHAVPTDHDSRSLTMDASERLVLQAKMAAYWTRSELPDESSDGLEPAS